MTTTAKFSPTWVKRISFIACLVLLTAFILATLVLEFTSRPQTVVYKGRSLETWFYGSRKDFFTEPTRRAAREAFDGVGTNAIPFLFYTLEQSGGSGALYFKIYRAMPKQVQAKLPYPISGDDIKAITLDHIRQMRRRPREVPQTLSTCVPGLDNPRVKMIGFNVMLMNYQTDPAFLKLCRTLLNDAHPGIRLKAAIYLAQSAIASDPGEPRLFPILLAALESSEQRKESLDLESYFYQQQPPGSPGPSAFLGRPQGVADPDDMLRSEIMRSLDRLERYLSDDQKKRLKRAKENNRPPAPPISF